MSRYSAKGAVMDIPTNAHYSQAFLRAQHTAAQAAFKAGGGRPNRGDGGFIYADRRMPASSVMKLNNHHLVPSVRPGDKVSFSVPMTDQHKRLTSRVAAAERAASMRLSLLEALASLSPDERSLYTVFIGETPEASAEGARISLACEAVEKKPSKSARKRARKAAVKRAAASSPHPDVLRACEDGATPVDRPGTPMPCPLIDIEECNTACSTPPELRRCATKSPQGQVVPPAPRLVCVETNPGPTGGKKTTKKVVKAAKKVKKAVAVVNAITGRGDYRPTQFQRTRGRGDYADTGHAIGSALGGLAGRALGTAVSPFLKILGMGDYRTKGPRHNSLFQQSMVGAGPALVSNPNNLQRLIGGNPNPLNMGANAVQFAGGNPRITHREFIGAVTAPGSSLTFQTTVYRIQPGIRGVNSLFPWGSSVAQCFQQYRLMGCIMEYKSTSTDFSSTTTLGSVMMSTLYDAGATPLASQIEVDNNEYTTSDKPSMSFIHPIECAPKSSQVDVRYVRDSNAVSTSADERLDDVGVFQISVVGSSASTGTQLGELWMSYDLELLKPALPDFHVGTTFQASGVINPGGTGLNPFTNAVMDPQNSLPATFPGTTSFAIPKGYNGNYCLIYTPYSAVSTISSFSLTSVGADITPLSLQPNSTGVAVASTTLNGYGTAGLSYCYTFSCTAQSTVGSTLTFSVVSMAASSNMFWNLMVLPLDNDITSADRRLEIALAKLGLPADFFSRPQALPAPSPVPSVSPIGVFDGPSSIPAPGIAEPLVRDDSSFITVTQNDVPARVAA